MMVLERAILCHERYLKGGALEDPTAVVRWQHLLKTFFLATEGDVVLPFDGASVDNCTVHR